MYLQRDLYPQRSMSHCTGHLSCLATPTLAEQVCVRHTLPTYSRKVAFCKASVGAPRQPNRDKGEWYSKGLLHHICFIPPEFTMIWQADSSICHPIFDVACILLTVMLQPSISHQQLCGDGGISRVHESCTCPCCPAARHMPANEQAVRTPLSQLCDHLDDHGGHSLNVSLWTHALFAEHTLHQL